MSGTKPTPGPWYVVRSSVNALHVCFDPGTPHAEGDEICALFGGDEVTPEMWANARLIVRAVNCHADLVAALEEFDAAFGAFHSEMYDRHSTAYRNACNRLAAAVKGARAALAKAGETE